MKILELNSNKTLIENLYEQEIDLESKEISLKRFNFEGFDLWTEKGLNTKLHLKDTGNGFFIVLGSRKLKLDYSELDDLMNLYSIWKNEFELYPTRKFKLEEIE